MKMERLSERRTCGEVAPSPRVDTSPGVDTLPLLLAWRTQLPRALPSVPPSVVTLPPPPVCLFDTQSLFLSSCSESPSGFSLSLHPSVSLCLSVSLSPSLCLSVSVSASPSPTPRTTGEFPALAREDRAHTAALFAGRVLGQQRGPDEAPRGWWGAHETAEPGRVLGDPGVDAEVAGGCAALAPADDTRQVPGALEVGGVWAPAVPLAGVLAAVRVAGAEHVVSDDGAAGPPARQLPAVLGQEPGHVHGHEPEGRGAALQELAPAADGREAHKGQRPLREGPLGQAEGRHVVAEGHGPRQAQQGQVVVRLAPDVLVGNDDLRHLPLLLVTFVLAKVVLACGGGGGGPSTHSPPRLPGQCLLSGRRGPASPTPGGRAASWGCRGVGVGVSRGGYGPEVLEAGEGVGRAAVAG